MLALFAVRMDAAQFLVITHSGGAWSLAEADSLLINGKEKVRSIPVDGIWRTLFPSAGRLLRFSR